jgi:ligand-binding sensor domain-containing protein
MIILSLCENKDRIWAAGPNGLIRYEGHWAEILQPQQQLNCVATIEDTILVGGAPYGVAYSIDNANRWGVSLIVGTNASVTCIAPSPNVNENNLVLAGTDSKGVLRSTDRGRCWTFCNFGLQEYSILALAWAPPPPQNIWPSWEKVFVATDGGLYRSINGGLAWRRCNIPNGTFQTILLDHDFNSNGIVFSGTEDNGLWQSKDGGIQFYKLETAPEQVDAIAELPSGYILSDPNCLWFSKDGINWQNIPNSQPALTLLSTSMGLIAGGSNGVDFVSLSPNDFV